MIFRLAIALLIAVVVYRTGIWALRTFGQVPPPPPPPGEMRSIKVKYRCGLCGVEARMTLAPTESPEPPRHCMEDMDLVKSSED
ncbi:MAG: hypothetical protein H0U92_06140 [Actinobacteria bacterium]|nr:hypothetical protein [Actinomycetota bacterium]